MENINISLGIELDKKQFNDKYIQGEVDKATWYTIKYLYNAVQKVTNLYSEGIDFVARILIKYYLIDK